MSNESLNEQRQQRLENLQSLIDAGFEAYPYSFTPTHDAERLQKTYKEKNAQPGDHFEENVTIAGRIMLLRAMGKATFLTLQDMTGRIQAYLQKDATEHYEASKKLDLGDWLEVSGTFVYYQNR